ncbi:LuxR C-terminal-related transcriptional regulator [Lentzea sp. NPDC102401]|uniref:LuxR C-terminal-related transcriptional regulator n=1 Tax=Lentzea sp. NPDC102401 TaxID=3364128 RepID=UPI00382B42DE
MADRRPNLTGYEQRLLQLIADGKTDREIADEVFFSNRTVKYQIRKLSQAFHARGRTNLVARAFRAGLMPTEHECCAKEATSG